MSKAPRASKPGLPAPLQGKFCRFAIDFQDVHGLSMTGENPRHIRGGTEISDEDWKHVFKCHRPLPGQRVKQQDIRPQFLEDMLRLHWCVYQEAPKNKMIGQFFAKAFALEKSKTKQFDWAHFAEEAMDWVEKHGNLGAKMDRWHEKERRLQTCSFTGIDRETSKESRELSDRIPNAKDDVKILDDMIVLSGESLACKRIAVTHASQSVNEAIKALHRAEGLSEKASELSDLQEGLLKLKNSGAVTDEFLSKMDSLFPPIDMIELQKKVDDAKVR